LKYTDPSGEFLLEAMIIGGFINTSIQLLSGNINSTEDFWMSFGIGALSGAAGAGAGSAVSSSLGVATTFGSAVTNGAITGAVGGFSGGFVSGAGNAWMGGANFADGLIAGGKSGISGAIGGAIFGGVSAGYKFNRNLNKLNIATSDDGVEMTGRRNQRVVYSNENARKFQEIYFGEQKGLVGLYADGTWPCPPGEGCAEPIIGTLKSNVYLKESAFRNKLHLFHVMGHEFVHVAQSNAGLGFFTNFREVGAYSWNEYISRMTVTDIPKDWSNELNIRWKGVAADLYGWNNGEIRRSLIMIDDFFWYNLPTFKFKGIPIW
jgi:hypothetical protein